MTGRVKNIEKQVFVFTSDYFYRPVTREEETPDFELNDIPKAKKSIFTEIEEVCVVTRVHSTNYVR